MCFVFKTTTKSKYLTKKNIKEYGITFTKIQEYFGYPCDIEFAIKKNKLYIDIPKVKEIGESVCSGCRGMTQLTLSSSSEFNP